MLNRIIYPAITLCVALFFTFCIDAYIFFQWNTLFTIVGGLCTTAALALALDAWLLKDRELNAAREVQSKTIIWVTSISFLFIFGYFLSSHAKNRVMRILEKEGVFTVGTITNGRSSSLASQDTYLMVKFTDNDRKDQEIKVVIGRDSLDKFLQWQKVGLIYLPKHPDVMRILVTDSDLNKYSGFKNRTVKLADLMKIAALKPGKPVQNYLNSVNIQWYMYPGDGYNGYRYLNDLKLQVVTTENGRVSFMYHESNPGLFNSEIRRYGFKKTNDLGGSRYENDKFILSVRDGAIPVERGTPEERRNYGYGYQQDAKPVTVFTIAPKEDLGL